MVYDLSGGTTSNLGNLAIGGSLLDSMGNSLSPSTRGYFTTSLSGQDVMLYFFAVPEPSAIAMTVTAVGTGSMLVRRRKVACRRSACASCGNRIRQGCESGEAFSQGRRNGTRAV